MSSSFLPRDSLLSHPLRLPPLYHHLQVTDSMWNRKPALSWLDRLRSSKGIPITKDFHNLEQFLNQNPNPPNPISIPKSQSQFISNANPNQESVKEDKWFSTMSSVLAELFVMEDDSNKSHQFVQKKSSRKQSNPRICVLSASGGGGGDDDGGGGRMSPASVDNSVADMEEEEELDVSGCSRLDLVIIDTSSVVWKTEKMVIRKGNVWRVREKKSKLKSISLMKKKRKFKKVEEDDDDDSEDGKKKKKLTKKKKSKKNKKMKQKLLLRTSGSVGERDDDDDQCDVLPFEGNPKDNNQIANKRTHPDLDQAPIKRCKFLRLSAKPGKKSSVPHLQNSPTGRKNVVPLL